jgi:hypothetical protein
MKTLALALLLTVTTSAPLLAGGQEPELGTDELELVTDEQILLKQVMDDKRSVYAANLNLSDSESRAFWPIYDEYEAKVKKLDDRFLELVNRFAAEYDTLSDAAAAEMLEDKMAIEKDRMALKQTYTRKVAKVLPARKALRYAQVETRIENMLRRDVYGLIPLAH